MRSSILQTYGYLAVFVLVGLESAGIPLPGETMLLVAAIYAGTTHQLAIGWVIAAAALGAILGDNLGYLAGREGGFRLLRRYGHYVRLNDRKLKLAVYLFDRHGPKVVFPGPLCRGATNLGRHRRRQRAYALGSISGLQCRRWSRMGHPVWDRGLYPRRQRSAAGRNHWEGDPGAGGDCDRHLSDPHQALPATVGRGGGAGFAGPSG